MTVTSPSNDGLNPDRIESQVSTVQLLQAMYPLPSELALSSTTESFLQDPTTASSAPQNLEVELTLPIDDDRSEEVTLLITLPLKSHESIVIVRPRQPGFLSRTAYEQLLATIPALQENDEPSEYILSTLEMVRDDLRGYLPSTSSPPPRREEEVWQGPEERVWFWFPSLSTKEKRDDLVRYAQEVGLTGFVLAGKPGLLCVEGRGNIIDRYMSRIKSESWSDIPPFQKKVTERLRRALVSRQTRAFDDMKEITELIPKYGQYGHRGDMSEVRKLMEGWGVGDDFGAVVLNNGS